MDLVTTKNFINMHTKYMYTACQLVKRVTVTLNVQRILNVFLTVIGENLNTERLNG